MKRLMGGRARSELRAPLSARDTDADIGEHSQASIALAAESKTPPAIG